MKLVPSTNLHQSPVPAIDRNKVCASFDCHAGDYETLACVQKRVVEELSGIISRERIAPSAILDIGCGTGMLLKRLADRFPGVPLTGIDLAPGMVALARQALAGHQTVEIVTGDAEQLPYPAERFDLVVSTSTFQWLENLDTAFAEVARVLKPGGAFRFALFGEGTLRELKESYRQALHRHGGTGDRTHQFLGTAPVHRSLEQAAFTGIQVWSRDEVEQHPDVPTLLRTLKRIGASNATTSHPAGLGERRIMLSMMEIYEQTYRVEGALPATYQVIYGQGTKP